ncbi:microsomal signal peptidase subunit [Heterostelium album PN500]|uniref:Signal peptidase complex catalytic subunit SEC11 n=1 Tax=Heterostelium pallidum (strain ATCC 26659 / Pp 5 / PN500) TaxID=670386 RepID=D3B6Y3_HETP5|nr:microsomal signal peptidase subunit [Heterostelium album PN500]EFA82526.1 microsomal signal peptidase subunit [Heterostelium album PN500]|eukprot:XP_020434643.1 microsomal signal peptidase subunit [Heterostelium album PN500]
MNDIIRKINPFSQIPKYQIAQQIVNFGLIVSSALMIWKFLMIVSGSESPIVVVLSGSMRPAFDRGDLLYLNMDDGPFRVGEIVVFKIDGKDIPIVHRILQIHEKPSGDFNILTKGDNNTVDDRGLYAEGQIWLNREHIIGRAKGFLPYVGMVTIVMHDYPQLKILLVGVLALFVLSTRE